MLKTSRRDCSGWSNDCDIFDIGVEHMLVFDDEVNNGEADSRDRTCEFSFIIEWVDNIPINIISLKWFNGVRSCDLFEVSLVRRRNRPVVYVIFYIKKG